MASCDERIESLEDKILECRIYDTVITLLELKNNKYDVKIKNFENSIKLVKTEKMLYKALVNDKSPKEIFSILLNKYDELMNVSYDISGNMVNTGLNQENDHLEFCKESLNQREYIKMLCEYGKNK